jgi:hypothetical protein
LSLRIMRQHNTDPDSDDTLSHENVTNGHIGVNLSGMSSLDHVTITELHTLGTLSTELSSDNNFATLGRSFHHESDNTVASTSDGKSSQKFELEGFGLSLGAKSAVLDTFGVELDGSFGKGESLLNNRSKLTDAATILSQDVLGAGGANDNFGTVGCGANFDTSVTVFGQLASQQLVQLTVEHTIGDELALAGHTTSSRSHGGSIFSWMMMMRVGVKATSKFCWARAEIPVLQGTTMADGPQLKCAGAWTQYKPYWEKS